jgi:Nif-specific regulatory protein
MRATLSIEHGEGAPRQVILDERRAITLGRSRENTMVLQDDHVSRRHAEIFFQDGQWLLHDFGALNGTRIDGQRIQQETILGHGQIIAIGELRLRFDVLEAGEAAPAELALHAPGSDRHNRQTLSESATSFLVDELEAIHAFMSRAVAETEPQSLIRQFLETIHRHTRAEMVGYLSFDLDNPHPRQVIPENSNLNLELSRQLNCRAREQNRTIWLGRETEHLDKSDSLAPLHDALCLPLKADGLTLGALHVYKTGQRFNQRQVHFCEVAADYAARSLERLRLCRRLSAEVTWLREQRGEAEELIGNGPAMRRLRSLIDRAASCSSTVLLQGETGAGKEPSANAIHHRSARARAMFIVCNCGAIAPNLLESELFGHVRGAFTGAVGDREGLFEQADNGTLFLDEIGDMLLDCQVKLLRVIEGKPFRPVGGKREIRADVRVIAATHKDLEEEVRVGRFRHDLFYRLQVLQIRVPPLREHVEDIPALADHFLQRLAARSGVRKKQLSPPALARLQEYAWPGNVRQLRAVLENAVVMSDDDLIEAENLWLPDPARTNQPETLNLNELTAWAIRQALHRTGGQMAKTAELLGIARETLRMKMKKFGIEAEAG